MGDWLLLGVDSLIACIAIGPIVERRWSVIAPLVVLFGVGTTVVPRVGGGSRLRAGPVGRDGA
jgi:hypothetical protein